jgi:hypothetical protein
MLEIMDGKVVTRTYEKSLNFFLYITLLNRPTPLEYSKVQSLEMSISTGYKTQTKQMTMLPSKDSCED